MAFFEIFHMKFSEFKNSTYFKSYVQKTTEKVEISSSAKIAVIFEFCMILIWKFNTTILSSVPITPKNLSTVPVFLSEIWAFKERYGRAGPGRVAGLGE